MGRTYVVDARRAEAFARAVVTWYDPQRRPFPWRYSSDPYYVTICEVLLQRTNAEKVVGVAQELFRRFPSPRSLAVADPEQLRELLRPLGLPARAQWVRQIAAAFVQAEREGRSVGPLDLERLPGVGPYVASAVRVLVFRSDEAVIDEHVLRVLRRVFGVPAPARRHPTRELRRFADSLVPPGQAREYNMGLLDLGRLVCRPTRPRCDTCPVRSSCNRAAAGGDTDGIQTAGGRESNTSALQ